MKKPLLCIHNFKINCMPFVKGLKYEIEWNPIDERIYLYNPYGFTLVSKKLINKYFI